MKFRFSFTMCIAVVPKAPWAICEAAHKHRLPRNLGTIHVETWVGTHSRLFPLLFSRIFH